MKMSDAMALAGGPGAIVLPLIGYLTAWVQVHNVAQYDKCLSKLPKVENASNLRFVHTSGQLWFYGYILIYFFILFKHEYRRC